MAIHRSKKALTQTIPQETTSCRHEEKSAGKPGRHLLTCRAQQARLGHKEVRVSEQVGKQRRNEHRCKWLKGSKATTPSGGGLLSMGLRVKDSPGSRPAGSLDAVLTA